MQVGDLVPIDELEELGGVEAVLEDDSGAAAQGAETEDPLRGVVERATTNRTSRFPGVTPMSVPIEPAR